MPSRYMQLPYRMGVGVVLINRQGLVLAGQRRPACMQTGSALYWQLPQGDIASGEPAREAALRVIEHDLGTHGVQVLAEAPGWFSYELPAGQMGTGLQGHYCGERQKWIAARYLSEDSEITQSARANGNEASVDWRWISAVELGRMVPPLKRELYQDVIATFAPFLPAADFLQTSDARNGTTGSSSRAVVRDDLLIARK